MNTPNTNDGGPAFPLQSIGPEFMPGHCGMSLRDWFAGRASEEEIQHWCAVGFANGESWSRSKCRYVYADSMLQERQQ